MQASGDERQMVDALLAKAEEERRRILEAAGVEAEKILAEARAQVAALREEYVRAARRRAEVEHARRISEARLARAAEETRVLNDAVEQAIARAREVLAGFRQSPAYAPVLNQMLRECLDEFPPDAAVRVIVDARDQEIQGGAHHAGNRPHLTVETGGPFLGGLMVSDEEGRMVVDNTFETRLQRAVSDIRHALAGVFTREETAAWPSATTTSTPASRP